MKTPDDSMSSKKNMENMEAIESIVARLSGLLDTHHINEIEVSHEGMQVRVRRDAHSHATTPLVGNSNETGTSKNLNAEYPSDRPSGHPPILSPTVGVFYTKPSPNDKDYVAPKQHVREGQILGLVESMKVFYPIHAPSNGTITDTRVAHGHSVEFGQPLFGFTPDAA